jgi:signal transduction histidine kinase
VYKEALDGLIIDRDCSPCGLAAASKAQVIAADVTTDLRWEPSPWTQLLVGHGLRAWWSTPILSGDERVIGIFAIYRREPATPTPVEEDLIRQFAHVASIAIERSQRDAELRRTDEALGQARTELAHVARVATLNAMAGSIAHEVSQPLSGILSNASACLRMLAADPPNVARAAETAQRTIRDANRATEVIKRLRAMFSARAPTKEPLDANDVAREVIALSAGELRRSRVLIQTRLANGLPPISADRVQLQQVILNLLLNAADAMGEIEDRPRTLPVATDLEGDADVKLTFRDSGTGIDPQNVEKLFEGFYTTKPDGMGVDLSICRSIIESHGGRLWAAPNDGPGATFVFTIPSGLRPAIAI